MPPGKRDLLRMAFFADGFCSNDANTLGSSARCDGPVLNRTGVLTLKRSSMERERVKEDRALLSAFCPAGAVLSKKWKEPRGARRREELRIDVLMGETRPRENSVEPTAAAELTPDWLVVSVGSFCSRLCATAAASSNMLSSKASSSSGSSSASSIATSPPSPPSCGRSKSRASPWGLVELPEGSAMLMQVSTMLESMVNMEEAR
mmetsp:Transcript_32540/g.92276  ORF Transcript_32540/g.92276 Transcript_32540/m.92276 type:complete len:205 (-) Transcript_32540:2792-3406(-)